MSFLTGTQFESINNQTGAGSALSNSTTATVISKTPGGAAYLPANFFATNAGLGKRLKIEAFGIISTASSSQGTLKIGVYADSTQGTLNSDLGDTGAFTPTASAANWFWRFDMTITCTATGASGTWLGVGSWYMHGAAAGTLSALNGSPVGSTTAVSLSTEAAYYLELGATWGTASASNTITCEDFAVYGCN